MNKIFLSLLIFILTSGFSLAEDAVHLEASKIDTKKEVEAEDTIETEFSIFESFDWDKDDDGKIDDDTLMGKIINKDITRTDVPTFLLKEELTYRYKKGPVSKIQYFGAYRGNLSGLWNAGDYDTEYDINTLQVGAIGKFKNTKTDFKIGFNPLPKNDLNYMQNFIADAYIVNNNIPHHMCVS